MKQLLLLLTVALLPAASAAIKPSEMVSHPLEGYPVQGTLAPDASKSYSRLPDTMADTIRPELRDLGYHSAGLAIRFRSDATHIGARWKALNRFNMNHMTPTGIRGVDLYVLQDDSTWTTVGAGRPALNDHWNSSVIMSDMPRHFREYMLYLPLYDGIDSVYVLTDSAAVVEKPAVESPSRKKPIVMYGTSILQGGCASRPGMVHTSILGRMLNREVINLGFSGNARLDPEIARLMASCDAGAYVLDMLPNCTSDLLKERLEPFIAILRESRPDTPILLVESPMFPAARHSTEVVETLSHKNDVLRSIYERLATTDSNLYYMDSALTLSDPEATVDNYHYTDTGFAALARETYKILTEIINVE